MIKNIDWIFFDVGGVLLDQSAHDKVRVNYLLETLQYFQPEISEKDVLATWIAASEKLGNLDNNVIELCLTDKNKLGEAIELLKQKRAVAPQYYDLAIIRPEAISIIPELAKKYKLGIMANQSSPAKTLLEQAGILKYFQSSDLSADLKFSKPDPRLFEAILICTGADPNHSAMVDDNIERGLIPAKKFGMKTVWYKLEERTIPDSTIDLVISSLRELL